MTEWKQYEPTDPIPWPDLKYTAWVNTPLGYRFLGAAISIDKLIEGLQQSAKVMHGDQPTTSQP